MDNKELIGKIAKHNGEAVDIKNECMDKLKELLAEGEYMDVDGMELFITFSATPYYVRRIYKEDGEIYLDFGDGDDMHIDDASAEEVIYMVQEILCDIENAKKNNVSPLVPIIRNVLKELHGIDTSYLNDEELEKVLNDIESDLVKRLRGGFEIGKFFNVILK